MTLDLGGGRSLVLAGGGQGLLWLAAGVFALALLLALYRYERRLVSRPMGLGLLGLRLLAVAVLVAALFEPIAARSYKETVRGRVIVGVDLSESMSTVDAGRSAGDRRRLARTLDLSPAEAPESLSRREVLRRLIGGDWMKRLADDHGVEAVGFARDTAAASPSGLADALKKPGKPDDPATLVTDWGPTLDLALKEGDAPILGVVLLTDGRQNAPGSPAMDQAADRLAARGVPIFPVLVGSTVPPRDSAIVAIKAPEGVYKGDVANVSVTVKVDGEPAGAIIPVTLERPGAPPMRQVVRAMADGSRPVANFRVPLDTVGPRTLSVSIGPIADDVRPDNDRRSVTIQVADDKAKVLLVDGEARWEFRYLRNALIRDPRASVESVVFHQPVPPGSAFASASYPTTLPPKPEGTKPDPLGAFDAIVVGDVEAGILTPEVWARLDAYVAERGGTLILSPGPNAWPAMAGAEAVRKLLPVIDPKPVPFEADSVDPAHPSLPGGVAVVPSPLATADAWPMLQFAADPERSRAVWSGLPRLPWVLASKVKPGATVLASAAGSADSAIIAAQPYGLGKVLWVGTDGTWRWRHRVGDAYHHRFWGQVARWAASGKLSAGNPLVRFGPDRAKVPEGEGARIQARFHEAASNIGPDLLLAARIFKAGSGVSPTATGEAVAVLPMRPMVGQPRAFTATAPPLPEGKYIVRLDAPQLDEALKAAGGPAPEAPLEIVARDTSERVELTATRDPLDRLASPTGGKVFHDYEAGELLPLLRARSVVKTRTEETTLWDRPGALLLFFALLTTEWVLRKRAGLP